MMEGRNGKKTPKRGPCASERRAASEPNRATADSAAVTGEKTVERFSAVTTPSRRCQNHVPERPFFGEDCDNLKLMNCHRSSLANY